MQKRDLMVSEFMLGSNYIYKWALSMASSTSVTRSWLYAGLRSQIWCRLCNDALMTQGRAHLSLSCSADSVLRQNGSWLCSWWQRLELLFHDSIRSCLRDGQRKGPIDSCADNFKVTGKTIKQTKMQSYSMGKIKAKVVLSKRFTCSAWRLEKLSSMLV